MLHLTRRLHAKQTRSHDRAGFTLIETLVSFFVLTMVVVGFVTLVALGMRSFRLSRARYLGSKIAEEGIELAINKRDNNVLCIKTGNCSQLCDWKEGLLWTPGLGSCNLKNQGWTVDSTKPDELLPGTFFSQYNSSDLICYKTASQNRFGICGGSETPIPGNYTREVRITDLNPENVKIQSIVTWKTGAVTSSVTLEEVLFGPPPGSGPGGGNPQIIPQGQLSLVSVDSEELTGENDAGINAIDGDSLTIWHTQWFSASPPPPHQITLSLGGTYTVTGLKYLPRNDGYENGFIADYNVYLSTDGSTWGSPVASGTFPNNPSEKTISFTGTSASFIRLVATSEVNGNPWTSAAEINVLGF